MTPAAVDVVVIGAGFTGLAAAHALHERGLSLVVLDARDRVGGKVESMVDGRGRAVDTGGQFANDDMTGVLALAAEAGAERVDTPPIGRAVTLPRQEGDPWSEGERLVDRIGAEHLGDGRSVAEWVSAQPAAKGVARAARSIVSGSTCHDTTVVPVSYLAQLAVRSPIHHEELQCWFAGTMHSLAEHLAAPLAPHLRLASPATSVQRRDGQVVVHAGESAWRARHMIIAVPPTAYASISFEPVLPREFTQAAAAFAPGTVVKFLIGYSQPFWLDHGRNGIAQFVDPEGLYFADASLPDAPTLVGFLGGPVAIEWTSRSAEQRYEVVLQHATAAFGEQSLRPRSFLERVWAPDQWGGGGYCNVLTHHAPTAVDTLSAGLPGITFASTELAPRFPGYVEGAIHSGRATADRVLHELSAR